MKKAIGIVKRKFRMPKKRKNKNYLKMQGNEFQQQFSLILSNSEIIKAVRKKIVS